MKIFRVPLIPEDCKTSIYIVKGDLERTFYEIVVNRDKQTHGKDKRDKYHKGKSL